jgi:hypothetical protein
MRTTRPPGSKESCSSTTLSGSLVAQHETRLTSFVGFLQVLQAPNPRVRTMERNARVSFIIGGDGGFMPNCLLDDKPLCGHPKSRNARCRCAAWRLLLRSQAQPKCASRNPCTTGTRRSCVSWPVQVFRVIPPPAAPWNGSVKVRSQTHVHQIGAGSVCLYPTRSPADSPRNRGKGNSLEGQGAEARRVRLHRGIAGGRGR